MQTPTQTEQVSFYGYILRILSIYTFTGSCVISHDLLYIYILVRLWKFHLMPDRNSFFA